MINEMINKMNKNFFQVLTSLFKTKTEKDIYNTTKYYYYTLLQLFRTHN